MSERPNDNQSTKISEKLKQALLTLLEAFEYAQDTESDRWEFASPLRSLQETLGLNEADLLWLVQKGFVEHAREVTEPGDSAREYRSTGKVTFSKRTCFVLTDAGVNKARSVSGIPSTKILPQEPAKPLGKSEPAAVQPPTIHWDPESRKLRIDGQIVKRFKWPALNQEMILCAFQEEGWPERIDDPLPPQPDLEPKRRLSDTIKCLSLPSA